MSVIDVEIDGGLAAAGTGAEGGGGREIVAVPGVVDDPALRGGFGRGGGKRGLGFPSVADSREACATAWRLDCAVSGVLGG